VDPGIIRIISVVNLPLSASRLVGGLSLENWCCLSGLPEELRDKTINEVDAFPFGMEETKALRSKLMKKRKAYVLDEVQNFGASISLCEH